MNSQELLDYAKKHELETDLLVAIETNEIGFSHAISVNVPIVAKNGKYVCQYKPFYGDTMVEYEIGSDLNYNIMEIEAIMKNPRSGQALMIDTGKTKCAYVEIYSELMFSDKLQDILYMKYLEAAGIDSVEKLKKHVEY